jgi:lipid-binding SYLF domain-containing protein
LGGAVVRTDKSGDEAMYGDNVSHRQILDGKVAVPPSAEALIHKISTSVMEAKAE